MSAEQITPEVWHALDHLQRRHEGLGPETVLAFTLAIPCHTATYFATLVEYARALIDAARPKCVGCNGVGAWTDYGVVYATCPECNGTGLTA